MSDCAFIVTQMGLSPCDEQAKAWLRKKKLGDVVSSTFVTQRNPQFHRKWFALMQLAFEHWSETTKPIQYKGADVQPDLTRFRRDITILAGRFHPVVNIKGEVRVEADSISFGKMSEAEFQKLYAQVIDVLLAKVFTSKDWDAAKLERIVEQIVEFAQ